MRISENHYAKTVITFRNCGGGEYLICRPESCGTCRQPEKTGRLTQADQAAARGGSRLRTFFQDAFYDQRSMFSGVLDKPDMRIHATANDTGEIKVLYIRFHRSGIVKGL